ncbi:hypothetical protein RND81_10G177800 [Saponaria officinalis]|uniref:Reverse transcriptase n=1 Tax=Saponaria officinalis TaxID=3572 RepID=A0AAW1I625_SAPOF
MQVWPILLSLKNTQLTHTPRLFIFEPLWTLNPSFKPFVAYTWNTLRDDLTQKISRTAAGLSLWAKTSEGNLAYRKRQTLRRLEGVQKNLGVNPLNRYLRDLESSLIFELEDILSKEELFWKTRARANWLDSGDRNTTFFHQSVILRRKRNRITQLSTDVGETLSEPSTIKTHILSFFSNLFTSSKTVSVLDTPKKKISGGDEHGEGRRRGGEGGREECFSLFLSKTPNFPNSGGRKPPPITTGNHRQPSPII